jgi:hypothetical protein
MMLVVVDEVVQKKDGRCPAGRCAINASQAVVRPLFRWPRWFATRLSRMKLVVVDEVVQKKDGLSRRMLCINASQVLSDHSSGGRGGSLPRQPE